MTLNSIDIKLPPCVNLEIYYFNFNKTKYTHYIQCQKFGTDSSSLSD